MVKKGKGIPSREKQREFKKCIGDKFSYEIGTYMGFVGESYPKKDLVVYCCLTNYPRTQWLKTTPVHYFSYIRRLADAGGTQLECFCSISHPAPGTPGRLRSFLSWDGRSAREQDAWSIQSQGEIDSASLVEGTVKSHGKEHRHKEG